MFNPKTKKSVGCDEFKNTVELFKYFAVYAVNESLQREGSPWCLAPRWYTLPSATNGFNPHKLEEVAQQEAKITGIMRAVCFSEKRGDVKRLRGSDKTAEEAGVFTDALWKNCSWGKGLSAACQKLALNKKKVDREEDRIESLHEVKEKRSWLGLRDWTVCSLITWNDCLILWRIQFCRFPEQESCRRRSGGRNRRDTRWRK